VAKILVVDDRPFNRQFLLTLLSYTGHQLLEAADGAAALALVRAEKPDVVISDILMPTMDGFQFAQQVRADPEIAATAIIFYTATYREPEARELAEACGVRTVLPKPSDPDVILAAVEAELGRAAKAGAVAPATLAPPAKIDDPAPIHRIDEQLSRYAEELRAVETTFHNILDHMSDVLAARDEMRKLSGRFSQSFTAIRRFAAKLTTMIEVTLDVNPERGSVHLLETFVASGRKIFNARLGAVAVFDETTKELKHLVTSGFDGQVYLDATDALSGVPGGLLAHEGVLRISAADVAWAPDAFPIAHPSPRSFMGTAVAVGERTQGWIYFADKTEGDFDDEDERILATVATQLAVSYTNTTVFDLLQHHAAKLQIEITRREKAESEIRAHEDQLAQSRKMEAVGQLTGGIAHDFNNLLTVIKGNAEHLGETLRNEPQLAQVRLIEEASDRGADLVRRLLAFARKQELKPEIVDLNAQLGSFLKLVRRTLAENVSLRLVPGESLPPVFSDPGSLENALLNLTLNAHDAMPAGGAITISTSSLQLSGGEIPGSDIKPGRYVAIAVTDSGTGMDKDVAARAFDPFFTTKEVGKGTGLGLSMVYGFVKQSGGHAQILSEPGKGTTVKLFLPAARGVTAAFDAGETAPTAPLTLPAMAGGPGKARVLLVEDDRLVREDVAARLALMGYAVTAVPTAADALTALGGGMFDVVMTDVIMPGRMNGGDLAREVLARWPETKVLATSGYTESALMGKVTLPDGVRFLAKPYSRKDLAAALGATLGT
jgi:signal transduction histidine kinase/CheY-like chemotaxis protein